MIFQRKWHNDHYCRRRVHTVMCLILILLASNVVYCSGRLMYRTWFDEFDQAITKHFNGIHPLKKSELLGKMFMFNGLLSVYSKLVFDQREYALSAVKNTYESTPFRGPTFTHCELRNVSGMTDTDILDVVTLTENIKHLWGKTIEMVYRGKHQITVKITESVQWQDSEWILFLCLLYDLRNGGLCELVAACILIVNIIYDF